MMKPIRPQLSKGAKYPREFREEAVRYWLSSGQKLATVAADLGLSPQCLRSWRQQMESASSSNTTNRSATDSSHELALEREVGQLRRELEAMTRQRDILKRLFPSYPRTKL